MRRAIGLLTLAMRLGLSTSGAGRGGQADDCHFVGSISRFCELELRGRYRRLLFLLCRVVEVGLMSDELRWSRKLSRYVT